MGACNSKCKKRRKIGRKTHNLIGLHPHIDIDVDEDYNTDSDDIYQVYNTQINRHILSLKKQVIQKRKYKQYTPIIRKYPRKLSDDSDCDSSFEKRYPYNPYINRTSPMRPMAYDSDSESRYESPKFARHIFSDDESEIGSDTDGYYPTWVHPVDMSESSTIFSICFGELDEFESPTE